MRSPLHEAANAIVGLGIGKGGQGDGTAERFSRRHSVGFGIGGLDEHPDAAPAWTAGSPGDLHPWQLKSVVVDATVPPVAVERRFKCD